MSGINSIKDENVRKVAQTLRSSGLAASDSEAERMAMSMVNTQRKIGEHTASKNNKEQKIVTTKNVESQESTAPTQKEEVKTFEKEEEIPGTVENLEQDTIKSNYLEGVMLEDAVKEQEETDSQNTVETSQQQVEELEPEQKEEETEPLQEEKEDKKEKDLSSYKEASVDLSQMFKFK